MHMRSRGVSRATGTAGTAGVAVPVPRTVNVSEVKIVVSAGAYGGVGRALTPVPAATADNTVYLDPGQSEVWTIAQSVDEHLYLYARTGTVEYFVSFYG